jgi:hypothetical protein
MKPAMQLSLYWKCQLIGWSLAALYWSYDGYVTGHFDWFLGILQFLSDVVLYITLTHIYRNFALARGWVALGFSALISRLLPAVVLMGFLYTVVTIGKIWLLRLIFGLNGDDSFALFIETNGINILIAGIRLMSIWLLAYHLYHYAQREIKVTKANAQLELASRDARLNYLSAQLNPHFLFNAMNTIKALVSDDPKSARRAIDLLSDLLRTGLDGSGEQLVSLDLELGMVMDYLELEKLRFEERLDYQIKIDRALNKVQVPRFSIQTLVENAVKHGISNRNSGGEIRVAISQEKESVLIVVLSPGVFKPIEGTKGLGLKNLKERLALTYGTQASLEIYNTIDEKVSAELRIGI